MRAPGKTGGCESAKTWSGSPLLKPRTSSRTVIMFEAGTVLVRITFKYGDTIAGAAGSADAALVAGSSWRRQR